jgi:hypothetical protein
MKPLSLAREYLRLISLKSLGKIKCWLLWSLDLSRIKMDTNEKVKDFNQRFLSLLKWISRASKHVEDVTIEFYTSSLPMSMAMFVKNIEKATLEANFQEALKIENNMLSLKGNPGVESSKD